MRHSTKQAFCHKRTHKSVFFICQSLSPPLSVLLSLSLPLVVCVCGLGECFVRVFRRSMQGVTCCFLFPSARMGRGSRGATVRRLAAWHTFQNHLLIFDRFQHHTCCRFHFNRSYETNHHVDRLSKVLPKLSAMAPCWSWLGGGMRNSDR